MTKIKNIIGFYKPCDYILTPTNKAQDFRLKLLKNEAKGAKGAIFQLVYIDSSSLLDGKRLTGLYLFKKFANRTIYKGDLEHLEKGFSFYVVVDNSGIVEIRKA
jgi:hypothetical protein